MTNLHFTSYKKELLLRRKYVPPKPPQLATSCPPRYLRLSAIGAHQSPTVLNTSMVVCGSCCEVVVPGSIDLA